MKKILIIGIAVFFTGCSLYLPIPELEQPPTPPVQSGWEIPTEGDDISAQGTRPDQAPEKDPEASDAIYTQESGSLNKVRFDSARNYFVAGIITTQLTYNPDLATPANNPDSIRGYFVHALNGNYYYISADKTAVDVTAASGTDNQTIDVFQLSGNNLQLSLEDDAEATKSVDLSGYLDNTDTQDLSIDSTGSQYTISLGNSPDIVFSKITDTNTQLSQEQVQDYAGAMMTGGTQSRITATYDDINNDYDFTVEAALSNYTNDAGFLTAEVDGSISNELQTASIDSTDTEYQITLSDAGGTVDLQKPFRAVQSGAFGTASAITIDLESYHTGTFVIDMTSKSTTGTDVVFTLSNPISGGYYNFMFENVSASDHDLDLSFSGGDLINVLTGYSVEDTDNNGTADDWELTGPGVLTCFYDGTDFNCSVNIAN